MQDFFTYASLGTLAGAVGATLLVTDFLKGLGPLQRLPPRLLVLAVAQGVVLLASVTVGHFAAANIPLYLLNGLLVAASATGTSRVARKTASRRSGKTGEE